LWVHVKHRSKPKGLKKKGHELYVCQETALVMLLLLQ
jgi:hypothetical protein